MAIKKSYTDAFDLPVPPDQVMDRCEAGIGDERFKKLEVDRAQRRMSMTYRKLTTVGDLTVQLSARDGSTHVDVTVRAAVDNFYAAFKSPGKTIIEAFRQALTQTVPSEATAGTATDEPEHEPVARASKQCPDCAETVLAEARKCKHCGYRFEETP